VTSDLREWARRLEPGVGVWARRLEPLADPALAAAAFALSVLPLVKAHDCGCDNAPTWAYLLMLASCLPLAVRRRWPFLACLTNGVFSASYGAASLPDPPVFYATLVALYSVAAHASRRDAQIAGILAGLSLSGVVLWDRSNSDFQDFVVNGVVFATAWLLGDRARNRRDRALALEARTEQLELTRAAEAEAAVVAERNRIARELHDVVAHHVSMIVVQAEAGPVALERDPEAAAAAFDTISAVGKQALAEMRRLLGVLKTGDDASLAPQPGVAQLADLVEGVRAAGLDVELDVSGVPRPVPSAVDLSAYRVVQESLTNCLRHAGPARVTVQARYDDAALRLDVDDDGLGGVGWNAHVGGHGLVAMRERVSLVGGTLEVGPRPGGGWAVRAVLPTAGVPGVGSPKLETESS
jgi:signal transduction histidine kinase